MDSQSSPINFHEHRADLLQPKVEIKIVTASRLSKRVAEKHVQFLGHPYHTFVCVFSKPLLESATIQSERLLINIVLVCWGNLPSLRLKHNFL